MAIEAPKKQLTPEAILSTLLDATGDLDTAEVLQKNLPAYLLKASPATLAVLDQASRDLITLQETVEKDLAALKPLSAFCIDKLTEALNLKWPAVYNVEQDLLSVPGADCGCEPASVDQAGIETVENATQTLLQAAMQNFSAGEEEADGFPDGSVVRIKSAAAGVDGLTPAAFAKLCRKLDLGKQYQAHFQAVFGLREDDGKVVATSPMTRDVAAMKKHELQLDAQLAALKGHITAAGLQTVQGLLDADGSVSEKTLKYGKRALIMQGIEVLDSCVWGVVVFSVRSVELYPNQWCMVYMPGEPERPLYEYSSFTAFQRHLAQQLQVKSYQGFFANSLDQDARADFFKTLAESADLGHIRQWPISVALFEFMVQSHVGKLQLDARKLAVPTDDIEEDARRKRLLDFLELGVTVASVAGLFVPVLGQLMMGVAVGQLLGEVYEGVEDWRRGDHQQALSHLFSVVENIAGMAAFAGGQKALGALGRKLLRSHPDFFSQFTAIRNRAGQARLWNPDLAPFEHRLPAGVTLEEGATELYPVGDKHVGRVDNRILSGPYDSAATGWRLEHPARPQAYAPTLQQHVEGGWRMPHEDADAWGSMGYTLKRMDPRLSEFGDLELDTFRQLSATSHEQVHRAFADNLPLPARMRDVIERARLERQLRGLVSALERGETPAGQPVEEQLHGLPTLPGWPTDHYIEVTDGEGAITATYPAKRTPGETLRVVVSTDHLADGKLLQTVIDGLYQREVDALLGGKTARNLEGPTLAKKLGAALKADHRATFERMYQRYDQSDLDDVGKLRQVYPDIPTRLGQTLIDQAPTVERVQLRTTGRVPLRLAQKVAVALGNLRLDRALTGFHLPSIANADTEKLAIQLLPRLSGWDARIRLTVREKSLTGPILEAIGDETAAPLHTGTLVKSSTGYEVFDGDGKLRGRVAAGPDSLYQAVLKALPARQRVAVGFSEPVDADAARLRKKLLDTAVQAHEESGRILTGRKPPVIEADCVQGNQPPATAHPRALLRKMKKLYPRLSEPQAIELIDQLGHDPLSRATRVKALRQDLQNLREALRTWSEDQTAMKALADKLAQVDSAHADDKVARAAARKELQEVRYSRKAVAEQIEGGFRRLFWRKGTGGKVIYALNLDGIHVGPLPTLPPGLNFEHIHDLSMKNMQQGDDMVYFLKSFKQLKTLELGGNHMTRLPEVLSHMPNLTRLSLAGNQIRLTEATLAKLSGLRTLKYLDLNGNPLGATPNVGKMFDLKRLQLAETGLTELPGGLAYPVNLEWVDLRRNQIRDLPQWLFKTTRRFSQVLNLRGNPLSPASQTHLENYLGNVGIGMGFLADDQARLDEQSARELWFEQGAGANWERRNRIWTAFKEEPRAEGLFRLLAELGNTADSEKINADMQRRVWSVLEAAHGDASLCDQLLELSANPIHCTDNAAVNFSHLEVAVEVDKVTNLADGQIPTAKPLLELGRGLFRLEQLNRIAREYAARDLKTDPLEVSLAFRIGLADALDLPGQPRNMRFGSLAGVTEADLDVAKSQITTAELSSAWLEFMQRQSFWSDYLKRTFARQFARVDAIYSPKLNAVFEEATKLSSADYLSQMDAIKLEREQAEAAITRRLTNDAIRQVDLGLCVLPEV
ncbi:NEL-type E3 ubiquitin ligase domain-containing protein [Pseudomonas sp. AKS31]|uniref:NEL-type E3 ubiquitin ligase domain-containing protein n=1 Tax=Pseudomonas sp. AKS31 TaxID=2949091 RepID=UPI002029E971|nr:NEL-type E3 ubiquitin ligase domain-containing protein [Pseudomonas sp. AKS31]MCL9801437.1 hypothetical protein [Pseudomonas sp. AKS31]